MADVHFLNGVTYGNASGAQCIKEPFPYKTIHSDGMFPDIYRTGYFFKIKILLLLSCFKMIQR